MLLRLARACWVAATPCAALRRASVFGFGSGSAAAAFFSGSASSAALFCSAREPARLRRFRRRLIAFHIFRRDSLRHAGHAPGKQLLALARQLLLFVETENVELVRIEIRRSRQAPDGNAHETMQARRSRVAASHAFSSFHPPRSAPTRHLHERGRRAGSRHRWQSCRYSCGPRRHRGCARPTAPAIRARCGGKLRVGSASGSSRRRMSASGAVSTSSMPARTAARSCQMAPSEASAAISS